MDTVWASMRRKFASSNRLDLMRQESDRCMNTQESALASLEVVVTTSRQAASDFASAYLVAAIDARSTHFEANGTFRIARASDCL
jgi:hypothetical protein